MSAQPLEIFDDDEHDDDIPVEPPTTDCCAGCLQLRKVVISLKKSDRKQWTWIWFVTGGVALGAFIVGQSGILSRIVSP